jgi:hypothetical protein
MNATDRKTLVEMHSDLTSQIEDLTAIRNRLGEDADKECTYANHAIDAMADASFYVGHLLKLTRGFYPEEAA